MKKKYVKDYVLTQKGEIRYCGKYYISKFSKKESKKAALMQILYSILCFALIIISLCIPSKGSRTLYIVIPLEMTFICLWEYLTGSLALRKVETTMEQKDYDKAYQRPMQSLTMAIVFYLCSFCGQIAGMVTQITKRNGGDFYFAICLGFLLGLSCVMWKQQRKLMNHVTKEGEIPK